MKVVINIPDRIGWALTDHAEARGVNLSGLIAGMVERAFAPAPSGRGVSLGDRVQAEWSKGAPDPVIAHRLREPVESVRVARRALNLKAHKFRRHEWAGELTPSETIEDAA